MGKEYFLDTGKRKEIMNEEQVKALCKWMVDNGKRPLSEIEKEVIKQAIDKSKSPQEMVASVLALLISM